MAYEETCVGALDALHDGANTAITYDATSLTFRNNAHTHWLANEDHEAIYDLRIAVAYNSYSIRYNIFNYEVFYPYGALWWFLSNCTGAVDMDAILSAMITADPSQVEQFIGVVDAYKQSVWNRPFNKEFYAALARGFMEWP